MTSNGRLPLEDGSDWHETLPQSVSDDLQLFVFRRRKPKKLIKNRTKARKCLFWRSYEFLSVTGRSVSKNDPRWKHFWLCTTFGGEVKRSISIIFLNFGHNRLTVFCSINDTTVRWLYDMMMISWYYDIVMLWYFDIMTLWYHGSIILWYKGRRNFDFTLNFIANFNFTGGQFIESRGTVY